MNAGSGPGRHGALAHALACRRRGQPLRPPADNPCVSWLDGIRDGRTPVRVLRVLETAGEVAANLLWPPQCAGCDEGVAPGQPLCAPCKVGLIELPAACARCAVPHGGDVCPDFPEGAGPLAGTLAAFAYGGALVPALLRWKHGRRRDVVRPLASLLAPLARRAVADADVALPVPLHPRRLVRRGFNQSLDLLRELRRGARANARARRAVEAAARADLPWPRILPDTLRRVRDTPSLGHAAPAERRALVDGAFAVAHPERVRGRRVLVADDVMTTGATLQACARALCDAGASRVTALVMARALPPGHDPEGAP